jgi:hypothetical protein
MLKNPSFISLIAALSALALVGPAQAQLSEPNLSGTYRCQPQPSSCKWQGQTLTISQSGPTIELDINKGEFAEGKLTSNITVSAGPPYNADGRIMPDHSIEWSNGTKWLKQSSAALAEPPQPNAGSAATTVTATGGGSRSLRSSEGPRSYPDHAVLNMTKDQLKAAPAFKFSR